MKNQITNPQTIKAMNIKFSKPIFTGITSLGTSFNIVKMKYTHKGNEITTNCAKFYYPNFEKNETNIVNRIFDLNLNDLTLEFIESIEK